LVTLILFWLIDWLIESSFSIRMLVAPCCWPPHSPANRHIQNARDSSHYATLPGRLVWSQKQPDSEWHGVNADDATVSAETTPRIAGARHNSLSYTRQLGIRTSPRTYPPGYIPRTFPPPGQFPFLFTWYTTFPPFHHHQPPIYIL